MGRIVFIWTVTLTIVAAVAVTAVEAFSSPRLVEATGHTGLDQVRITADATVSALEEGGLVPGARYGYSFKVTNAGKTPVDDMTVRSEKAIGGRAGSGLGAYAVQGGQCKIGDRVECVVAGLDPGETREFTVEAESAGSRAEGDELRIRTYLGRFAPDAGGDLNFEVAARAETGGCFRAPTGASRGAPTASAPASD
ncbi:hypothetical protein [Actinocorallia longicatena]|uniref:DUF11 domain-containing protein n=1 Tax=Actinocorallia longicatena TaxID=111803 RepID=A0ABP6QK12_9ACTN